MTFRAARMAAGLTQAQAGAVIGASKRAVQEWEGGRRNCPAAKLMLFALLTATPPAGTPQQPAAHPNTSD